MYFLGHNETIFHGSVADCMIHSGDKVCLVVIDGWGMSSEDPRDQPGDAILQANTPVMDSLTSEFGCCPLLAHGEAVGLPAGLMGNSEVGHLNIGAGRIVYQDILRIEKLLQTDAPIQPILETLSSRPGSRIHLIGLLSDGGVHSHIDHLFSLLGHFKANGDPLISIHAITDGRDTAPKCAAKYLDGLIERTSGGNAKVATVMGRYWAMDRDKRWERTQVAFEAMTTGKGQVIGKENILSTLEARYEQGETDEFLKPIVVKDASLISDNDVLVFFNFRSDRMKQIVQSFGSKALNSDLPFDSKLPKSLSCFTMTRYREDFPFPLISAPQVMSNVLAEYLAERGIAQVHVAETEKFSHVTVFFNGGREKPYEGEERILIPSPKVATYDLDPPMSSSGVADAVIDSMSQDKFGFVMCNFAPPDMVGHTGCLHESIQAVQATDLAIGRVYEACKKHGYTLVITADHGNAEKMVDACTGAPHKAHTCAKVPFIVAKEGCKFDEPKGREPALCDVAPSILTLMGLEKPSEMTGQSLIL